MSYLHTIFIPIQDEAFPHIQKGGEKILILDLSTSLGQAAAVDLALPLAKSCSCHLPQARVGTGASTTDWPKLG